jgi:hypothetical protein
MSIHQQANICYYDYANVGFTVSVPLSQFQLRLKSFSAYLIIHAKKLNIFQKIPLYFPLDQPIKTKINDIEYSKHFQLERYRNNHNLLLMCMPVPVRRPVTRYHSDWG